MRSIRAALPPPLLPPPPPRWPPPPSRLPRPWQRTRPSWRPHRSPGLGRRPRTHAQQRCPDLQHSIHLHRLGLARPPTAPRSSPRCTTTLPRVNPAMRHRLLVPTALLHSNPMVLPFSTHTALRASTGPLSSSPTAGYTPCRTSRSPLRHMRFLPWYPVRHHMARPTQLLGCKPRHLCSPMVCHLCSPTVMTNTPVRLRRQMR